MPSRTPTLGLIIQWGSDGWTAGPNYLKNIALASAALPPQHRIRLVYLVQPNQVASLEQYQHILSLADDIRLFTSGVPLEDIDVLYPVLSLPEAIPSTPARVHWIPDFQHCHLPHLFSAEDIQWRNRRFASLAAGSDLVVLSSQTALNDFQHFFDVRCPTVVLRFISSPEPGWVEVEPQATLHRLGIESSFIMCCNQFWKHKDHLTLFKALHLLRQKGKIIQLVCTGAKEDHRNPQHFDDLCRFIEEHQLSDQIRILGLIDRSDQIQLLRACHAVVQPSLFEGWSTVIEDCRMLGKTVVYSDIPVHLEQAPPYGIPFTAGDPQALARVIDAHWDSWAPTAGTPQETQAIQDGSEARVRFGQEIRRMVQRAMAHSRPETPPSPARHFLSPTTDEVAANTLHVKGTQWYARPLAGASTLAAPLFTLETYQGTLRVLYQLAPDDYLLFLRAFMSRSLQKFGEHWRYADICTVLYTLAHALEVENYLEIGVRQGRSMAMVVSRRPHVQVTAFDMWQEQYAGMDNPGPDFVQAQMNRLGHKGTITFINGNSHETLPRYFAAHPRQTFDLITVDGDHTPEGARQDLEDVLPRLRVGGAIVFDDIAHPTHPELLGVWQDVVLSRPEMSGFLFTELGYGVAFAVRMR